MSHYVSLVATNTIHVKLTMFSLSTKNNRITFESWHSVVRQIVLTLAIDYLYGVSRS